jgi:uncharacterized glyoxalase superfamily protein PhnB
MSQQSKQLPVNRSMASCSIIPVLGYENVGKAIEWLCNNFGFTERWRAGNHRAQLDFGDGTIAVSAVPKQVSSTGYSLMVRVADVNSHYENAKKHLAKILQEPTDFPYGERQYNVEDLGGYIWTFSQSIADLTPEDWGGVSA